MNCLANLIRLWIVVVHLFPYRDGGWLATLAVAFDVAMEERIERFLQTTPLAPARRCKAFVPCSRRRRLWVIMMHEVNHDRKREQNP